MNTKESRSKLRDIVKEVLEESPKARDLDPMLIALTYQKMGYSYYTSFAHILNNIVYGKLPSFESVTRAARKVKQEYPKLAGSEENQNRRKELEEEYRNEC